MPETTLTTARDLLRDHMRKERLTQTQAADLMEVGQTTVSRFLRGLNVNPESLDNIVCYLKNMGVLTRFGFPTDEKFLQPTPTDRKQLEEMGITEMKSKIPGHYVCTYLDNWQKALVVHGIMQSTESKEEKLRLLGQMFPTDFPSE